MIIDEITPDDIITVLEHVQATCAVRSYCDGCRYLMRGDGCALAHLPERWKLDDIIRKVGDEDDQD
mgnify:CR=1 FL=1